MDDALQIKDQLQTQDLFEAFKAQLKKDLEECACDGSFVEELKPSFDEIKQEIFKEIKRNEKRTNFNLQQLLYRVDINEKRLNAEIKANKSSDHIEIISELIIKRILQKVVLKKYFSSNENKNRIEE